ncbi:hypothetical protein HDU97_009556 [Phlyctochytrium planicorne]|nr:hypothetical protein HDU97_009556 [Phlyctochytrium planicorne]
MSPSGDTSDIQIPAVFVSHDSLKKLRQLAIDCSTKPLVGTRIKAHQIIESHPLKGFHLPENRLLVRLEPNPSLFPLFEMIIVTIFSPILVIFGLWCLWIYNEVARRWKDLAPKAFVKSLPVAIVNEVVQEDSPCCICLENYEIGELKRTLPCQHKFHANCIDRWLTAYLKTCPLCKADITASQNQSPPAAETTPLLMTQVVNLWFCIGLGISSASWKNAVWPAWGKWIMLAASAIIVALGPLTILNAVMNNRKLASMTTDVSRIVMFFVLVRDVLIPIYGFTVKAKIVKQCTVFSIQNPSLAPAGADCNKTTVTALAILTVLLAVDALVMVYADVIIYSYSYYLEESLYESIPKSSKSKRVMQDRQAKPLRAAEPLKPSETTKGRTWESYGSFESDMAPLITVDHNDIRASIASTASSTSLHRTDTGNATWGTMRSKKTRKEQEEPMPPLPDVSGHDGK